MSIVLMYHRVADVDLDPFHLTVSNNNFRDHMAIIRRLAAPRRLIDTVDNWGGSQNDVAVTFDDGYADNLLEATPILEAEEVPATIYVSTGLLDTDGFWIDKLTSCLLTERNYPDEVTLDINGKGWKYDLHSPEARRKTHSAIHGLIRNLNPRIIDAVIGKLADALQINPTPPPQERPLTKQEVSELASHPLIELGGHTVTHPCLPGLKPDEQKKEIETCKTILQELGAPDVMSFAYPFGDAVAHSFTTRRIVRKTGWHSAVISEPKKGWWFNRYAVPRYYVGDWKADKFENYLGTWLQQR